MKKEHYGALSSGIFLIGLGLILLLPGLEFWPWILIVIGLAGLPASLAANRGWLGWQGFFWMVGLAVLFWSGYFWPGILILIGLSTLLGALYHGNPPSDKEPFSPEPSSATPSDLKEDALFEEGRMPSSNETRNSD